MIPSGPKSISPGDLWEPLGKGQPKGLFVSVHGLLIVVASLGAEHRLWGVWNE